jgi:exonuclease III
MDNDPNRKQNWNILNWNVRGLNLDDKHNAIRAKLEESACSIFYLQETKSQHFDHSSIRKMAPKNFNKFDFVRGYHYGLV